MATLSVSGLCDKCGYRMAGNVDQGECPRCNPDGVKAARQRRVMEAVARTDRLVSWLYFLRHVADSGAGDTATRLQAQCSPHADAHKQLTRLLKQCGCEKTEARVRLNERFPYA